MAITLNEVKEYLRIDSDVEDALLTRLKAAAEAYLSGAISEYENNITKDDFAKRAEMVALAIISDLYENRNQGGEDNKQYGRAIESMIRQLQNYPG